MRRAVLLSLAGLVAAVLVCVLAGLIVLQTGWFRNQVRLRIISTAERASGGRVAIDSFDFDWSSMTATVNGFVLHGTEPAGDPALFRANRVQVGLKIVSILEKDVDISQLLIDRPEIYLLIHPDGSTNIPAPRKKRNSSIQDQILKLAVKHFELRDGTAQVNERRIRLNVKGEQLKTDVEYDASAPRYLGSISSRQLHVETSDSLPFTADLNTGFEFAKDHLAFNQFSATSGGSRIEGSAALDHFSNLSATVHVKGDIDAREASELLKFEPIRSGRAQIAGDGSYTAGQFRFTGSLNAEKVTYRWRQIDVAGAAVQSAVLLEGRNLYFRDLKARALGAAFRGRAELLDFERFSLDGDYSGLRVAEAGRFALKRPLPFGGVMTGAVSMRGRFKRRPEDFVIRANAGIAPGSQGVPVSGSASVTYEQRGNVISLGNSHLELPHSTFDVSGTLGGELQVTADSTDLKDVEPATSLFTTSGQPLAIPVQLRNGRAHFAGTLTGPLDEPVISGQVNGSGVRYERMQLDSFTSAVTLNSGQIKVSNFSAVHNALRITGSGNIQAKNWDVTPDSEAVGHLELKNADLTQLRQELNLASLPEIHGHLDAAADFSGALNRLVATGNVHATAVDAAGEAIDAVDAKLQLAGNRLRVDQALVQANGAVIHLTGSYERTTPDWTAGHVDMTVATPAFALNHLSTIRTLQPGLDGRLTVQLHASGRWGNDRFSADDLNGIVRVSDITLNKVKAGNISAQMATSNHALTASLRGNLRDSEIAGQARLRLSGDYDGSGSVHVSAVKLSTLKTILPELQQASLPFEGVAEGSAKFEGPFARPTLMSGSLQVDQLRFSPDFGETAGLKGKPLDGIILQNAGPILLNYRNGEAVIQSFRMTAQDTTIEATGRIPMLKDSGVALNVNGDLNLRVLQTFVPGVESSGTSKINATIAGSLHKPVLGGTMEVTNSSFYESDLTLGIDRANGLIRFDNNRATLQRFRARSGGGIVNATGFVTFGGGVPPVYRINTNANNVRVRYNGVSVTFDGDTRFTGTGPNSLLSGTITVTKAAFNPNTDVGRLFAASSLTAAVPSPQSGFLHRMRLELDVQSSASLELTTSLSQDVQAEIDLRVRGTLDRPAVLGRCAVNEGQIQFFGTRYTINHGEVDFFNPLKVEPVLDLNLETQARGVVVNISIAGTLEKLNVNYRSDPPLQSSEIIALLATGRAPESNYGNTNAQAATQNAMLAVGASSLLGSAINPASNRLQRFFGVTHLKIDPMVQGIASVPQARLTLEQQISRQVTITYVTNLSRTSEQIFRLEWALNREYSVVAIRDENGLFGIDVLYKRRFK